MKKSASAPVRRPRFDTKIAAQPDPKVIGRYHIMDADLRDAKTGPRLNPVRKTTKPGGEQTSWLERLTDGKNG